MEVEKQVQKATSLIARLRAVDTDFRVFGAESHRYQIGPTLSENELRAFEHQHQIKLPSDYRLYLKTVGNGNGNPLHPRWSSYGTAGAGPDYGIYRVEGTVPGTRTSEPFPYEEEIKVEIDVLKSWRGKLPGLLEIGDQGCSGSTHLCVKGPTYGTVWYAWEGANFRPTGLSFTDWICEWAERAIPRVIQERITNSVKVGMSLQEVISICSDGGKRPHSIYGGHYLSFEGLATGFDIDENNSVTRIVAQSI